MHFKKARTSPEVCQGRAKKNKDYLQFLGVTTSDVLGYILYPVKEKKYAIHPMLSFIFFFSLNIECVVTYEGYPNSSSRLSYFTTSAHPDYIISFESVTTY